MKYEGGNKYRKAFNHTNKGSLIMAKDKLKKLSKHSLMTLMGVILSINTFAVEFEDNSIFDTTFWKTSHLLMMDETDTVTVEGSPSLQFTAFGSSVEFNGVDERIIVDENPIFGAEEFTIEAVIYPYSAFEQSPAPRFLHIESADNKNRRITLELRLTKDDQWYFDAFIKSDLDKFTLVEPTLTHPMNQWYHTAITYKDGEFTSYINGQKELSHTVTYQLIPENAKTSIGARMNQVNWFNGLIDSSRFTNKALSPEEFDIPYIIELNNLIDTANE